VTILAVTNLTVAYGKTIALREVSLAVPEGKVVCLIGANGAGKTTTMRAISGLLRPQAGRIAFGERSITSLPAHAIFRLGLAHVPEGRQIFAEMTVAENLRMGAYTVRSSGEVSRRQDFVVSLFPRLAERLQQNAGSMSGGEQQMLALGRALMSKPSVLLLDEPSLGLAPLFVEEIFQIIARLKASGRTILIVEQNASAALDVADYAYVLENGQIRSHGPAAAIAQDPAVIQSYLGG
jgi:branched-chain amino acid transport system ATP-binding protein